MIKISMVATNLIPTVEIQAIACLKDCETMTNGRYKPGDMLDECKSGQSRLWIAYDDKTMKIPGVAVTTVQYYPRMNKLLVKYVGGKDFKSWGNKMADTLHMYTFEAGCTGIEAIGRIGWLRLFKNLRPVAIFMETSG